MFRFVFSSALLSILLLSASVKRVYAQAPSEMEQLAMQYARVIGQIELINVAFTQMNARCETDFITSAKFLPEVDYLLRKNMDYRFDEFVHWMEGAAETRLLATQMVDEVIAEHGGCDSSALTHWFRYLTELNEQENLAFLRQNKLLFGLPKVARSEHKIQLAFNAKINDYQNLPYQEIHDLASALDQGSYRYSLLSLSQSIIKDSTKAQTLWQFAVDEFDKPGAYYALGKSLQEHAKDKALGAFKQSAQKGYRFAETWLGTYYACHNNMPQASFWLEKAKQDGAEPEYIDDIYAEIDELGTPTNCVDGWVY
ncbi:hypothetical protein Patl_1482 [Paraglaciecola sp. T6c]|uniref:hypothetical protein n=1 Tax=Pseudoalteromonas atlantica (strain T6c / ATCC BAA-1087) TaxID=3042615 RepID=UPI00005C5561|nr:hypothetical protein [Paraglaciecola sp. T6c]ABG40005.1 hypothetical protein Patl_1482 [Paraglaciecola sp. T6c]